jgi:hypothetical protein
MKDKPAKPDELRMRAADFDKMMRRAIQTSPPAPSVKSKAKKKKPAKH